MERSDTVSGEGPGVMAEPPVAGVPVVGAVQGAAGAAGPWPWVALLGAMLLFGGSFVGLKVGFAYYDPMVVIFGRMLVACVAFTFLIPDMALRELRRRDVKWLVLMTLCEPCLYFVFESKALEYTTAGQAGLVVALLPVMVGVAAAVVLRERLSARFLVGCVVAVMGIALLSFAAESTESAPNPLLGNFYEFLAMVCAVGYTITAKALVSRCRPVFIASLQGVGGTLFFLPFLFLPGTELPTEWHWQGVLAVVFLGLGVTWGAFLLYVYGLRHVPAGRAAVMTNLVPVFAVFMGWLWLGETLNGWQVAAVPVVMVGVLVSQWQRPA